MKDKIRLRVKKKKKKEILKGFDGKNLLRMLISQAGYNIKKKYQKPENQNILPAQPLFLLSSGKEL